MDRITEKYLAEFSREHQIDGLSEAKQFEHLACFSVIKQHYNIHFDTDDVITGDGKNQTDVVSQNTNVGGDTGIDGIAIIVNGSLITDVETLTQYADETANLEITFIFVQAQRSESFDTSTIGDFGIGVVDFFAEVPRLRRNQRIANAAEIQSAIYNLSHKFKSNPSCYLYYVTNGKWVDDDNLRARVSIAKDDLNKMVMFSTVEFLPVDAARLQGLYRQTKNAVTKTFNFPKKIAVEDIHGIKEAYIGFLPATDFVKLITRDSGEMLPGLFDSNVRDWYGYNDVNKEIRATLESSNSDMFVLMNNGITIIANKIVPSGNRLSVTDFQVVNGCQTSHVLVEHRALLTDKIMVPVRVIGIEDETLINSIVRGTNRQTEVREDQFFALQEFPKQLEHYFQAFDEQDRKLYYERRTCQYDRLPIEKVRVITEANVIRSFASMFLDEPHRTTRNYKSLREKVGKEIFSKGDRIEPYYAASLAFYRLDMLFRQERLERKLKPARFHILMVARMKMCEGKFPRRNSGQVVPYCQPLLDILWDQGSADRLLFSAADLIVQVADGHFERDNIRTEGFTSGVKLAFGNSSGGVEDGQTK
jgi:AIPR protein